MAPIALAEGGTMFPSWKCSLTKITDNCSYRWDSNYKVIFSWQNTLKPPQSCLPINSPCQLSDCGPLMKILFKLLLFVFPAGSLHFFSFLFKGQQYIANGAVLIEILWETVIHAKIHETFLKILGSCPNTLRKRGKKGVMWSHKSLFSWSQNSGLDLKFFVSHQNY